MSSLSGGDLRALTHPRAVAVVGASDRNFHARTAIENLRRFSGDVIGVNPSRTEVAGLRCVPSLRDADGPIDLAVVLVGRSRVPDVLADAHAAGIQALIVNTDGYAEAGDEVGGALQAELVTFAQNRGMVIVGPNSLGVISARSGCAAFCGPLPAPIAAGGIAVISQSGGNCLGLIAGAHARGLGLHTVVSTGNEAQLDAGDYLEHFVADETVTVMCVYLEAIRRPEHFLEAALTAARHGKPIVAVKIGRSKSGGAAALAHTGALAGSDEIVQALFDRGAVVRADDLDDALDACIVFEQLPRRLWPPGRRIAAFCLGGGAAGLLADLSEPAGITFPEVPETLAGALAERLPAAVSVRNPIDVAGPYVQADTAIMEDYLGETLRADRADAAVASSMLVPEMLRLCTPSAAVAAALSRPLFVVGITEGPLSPEAVAMASEQPAACVVAGPSRFVRAFSTAARWAERSVAASRDRGELAVHAVGAPEPGQGAVWRLLARHGLVAPRQQSVTTGAEALAAAERIGYPVVLKAMAAAHKSDQGLVEVGLGSPEELERSFLSMSERAAEAGLSAPGWIVQEQVTCGVEVFLGVQNDAPGYPPVVLVGAGGVLVELLGDVAMAPVPLDVHDADELVDRTRVRRLVQGFRGAAAGDGAALRDAIVRLGRLALESRVWLRALDLNPVIVTSNGVLVVDALMVTD